MASRSSHACELSVKLRVGRRAEKQVERMEAWWVANRPKAPTLFTDELEATFRLLCERRNAGVGWPTTRRPELRRMLMRDPRSGLRVPNANARRIQYAIAAF